MVREIELTRGKVALVDDEDFAAVSAFNWYATLSNGLWYAKRKLPRANGKQSEQSMHAFLLQLKPGETGDHTDGDGLNNTRTNLRIANRLEQVCNRRISVTNTSGYVGVHWSPRYRIWHARIRVDGKHKHIGSFQDPAYAARAYDAAARLHRGDFARLNFPNPGERGVHRDQQEVAA